MKETIYKIPVNEVYDLDCECPLCELEKRLEKEAVEYSLGAAMMEPDFRIISNEKGFCRRHFTKMFAQENKLSLALVLDTHLKKVRQELDIQKHNIEKKKPKKQGLFKKGNTEDGIEDLSGFLKNNQSSCVICDKVNKTMARYIDVLMYMWATDDDFKAKFQASKGLCLMHFLQVTQNIKTSLNGKDAELFINTLITKETEELDRIQDDIHRFTLKFDYRNRDMEWGTAKDAPIRTIEKLSGYINEE